MRMSDWSSDVCSSDLVAPRLWACQQPWSNGHIGLYGFSASAIAVYNTMHLPLPCVAAAAPLAGTNALYRDLLYPGGGMNLLPGAVVGLGVSSGERRGGKGGCRSGEVWGGALS